MRLEVFRILRIIQTGKINRMSQEKKKREAVRALCQSYLGMRPSDKSCTDFAQMQNKMTDEIFEIFNSSGDAEKERFTLFYEAEDVFSNWYMVDFVGHHKNRDKVKFNCSEQAMMYYKAMFFKDKITADKILAEKQPSRHKQLGREVKGFDSKAWDAISRHVVYRVCYHKFCQNLALLTKLVKANGTTFVEASDKDILWGCGIAKGDSRIYDRKNWTGKNWLGQVLTQLCNDIVSGREMDWDDEKWMVRGIDFE